MGLRLRCCVVLLAALTASSVLVCNATYEAQAQYTSVTAAQIVDAPNDVTGEPLALQNAPISVSSAEPEAWQDAEQQTSAMSATLPVIMDAPADISSGLSVALQSAEQQTSAMSTMLQASALTCDGTQRTIVLPSVSKPYSLPNGMSCGRPNGGFCDGLSSIVCKPFTDTDGLIGPITYGNADGNTAPLLISPENPLVFTLAPGSFMTYVAWRVYDVGTGGARLLGRYPAGASKEKDIADYTWARAPTDIDGDGHCDTCTNCEVGKGIKDMQLRADPGTGYTAFELSQVYSSPKCGASCFDLDSSYWTGMTYSCVQPTCRDTDLTAPGNQKYNCPAGSTYNMDAGSDTNLGDQTCCKFKYTCGDVSSFGGNEKYNCVAYGGCDPPPFEQNCFEFDPKSANTEIDATRDPAEFVPICCTKKTPPQSAPDVYVIKQTVAPKSQPVGSQFTFTIEVGVKGLSTAVARNVVLEDEVPAGLLLDSAEEITEPGERACQMVFARKFRCTWPVLLFKDVRTVQVTVTGQTAGDYTNTAFVKTSSGDTNPNNNQDSDTLQVKGACCNSRVTPPSCSEVPSKASCPDPNSFSATKNCNEVPCGPIPGGACCLELMGQCIERTYEAACSQAGGTWYKGKLCDELRRNGVCKQPRGACCNVRSGECAEDRGLTQCDLKWSTWWKDGTCSSDGYCSGSCCDTASGNCYQSKKADCAAPTQSWTIYGQCDPVKCPSGDKCTPAWYKCKPKMWNKQDECCPGYSCQEAPKGCKVGRYVCQPKFTPKCGEEGFSCGGKSGGVCCEGYACYWDYKKHKGSCQPEPNPDYCRKDGDQCGDDRDCCYGSRCCVLEGKSKKATKRLAKHGGQCTPVTPDKCHKDCYDYDCYVERKKDCDALYATSAAKLSATGAKYMV